ncbi:MBG domain-containing protein [Flavobacterium sp. NKUCC04_CG]|uniref:MBG domain-containing protein n=1 Tax=Flavobacterium sp. NKUCC04_CG TaxID=2842121 RepID=UPI001C5BB77C|nr:MBG domain-containing protein [Flavobacterium sp. NKUCC04_CG]MBW3519941.1 T9SS type A sorting domain-containing protein [Flavobacterium sp. NKUCC04_CG]
MAKKHFIIWILLCSFSTAIAQNFVPIKIVSGFNADVIANGIGPVSRSTTHRFDIDGFTLMSRDFVAEPGNTALTFGLPIDGRIIASYDPSLIFQLNPYSQNNSLRLEGSVRSGDLVFQTPENATRIVLLTAAGNAIGSRARFSGEIRFTDNTIQLFNDLYVEDWYSWGGSAPTVTYGMGRVSFLDNLVEESRDFPRLFGVHIDLSVSNYYKKISSIHVFKTSTTTEVLNIMAVTVKKTPDCFQPTNIKIDNISTNQATISWDAAIVAPNLGYEYEIRTSGVAGSGNSGLVASGAVSNSSILQDIANLISSTEYFVYVRSKCTATSFSNWSLNKRFETRCLTPTVVATGDVSCQPVALNLTATTTDGEIRWYDSPTSNTVLHRGENYTTPVLSESKYYYVEGASSNFVSDRSGKDSLHSTANNFNAYHHRGVTFDLNNDVFLKSTDVFVGASGTLDVAIYDSSGTELFSTGSLAISALGIGIPVTIPLNVHLKAGQGYRLVIKSFYGITLYRDSNVSFPYSDSSEILTVTSSWSNGSPNPNYYYYFYNLTFERGCKSPRQAVLATVYNTLAPTTSLLIQTFCFDAGTQLKDLSVDGSNIKWYTEATGGNPWSETAMVADGTTYYASQTLNGCESMDRLAITTILERVNVFSVNQNIDYNYKDVAAALAATPAPGNKIFWYLSPAAVDGDETAPVPDTNTVGVQKYWVREISALGCISDAVEITVTVNPVELTLTADSDLRKVFGASDPVLTYTATGFVGLDDNSLFTGVLDRISGEVVGSYAITQGTLNAGPNYTIRFISNLFTIEKAPLTAIVFDGKTVTYDGTTKSLVLTGLPTGATVSYTNNDQIDAGTYTVTATINGGTNYVDIVLTAVLTIEKAVVSGITFDSQTVVYDGAVKSLVLTGLPTGATVSYTNNDQIDAGTHTVTATINGGTNYEDATLTAVLTIEKAVLSGITFDSQTAIYDGGVKSLVLTGLPTGATVTYTNNNQIDAGTYTVTATINGGTNYEDTTLTAVLTIEKAVVSGITFDSQTVIYDGAVKSLVLTGLPTAATVTYTNNDQIDAGTYTVTATIIGGTNYEDATLTAVLTIEKAAVSGITFDSQTVIYDGAVKSLVLTGLPTGATVSYTNNDQIDAGTYTITATINGGTNYEDATLSAVLTIEKAVLSGIVFNDQTTIYDGTTKSLVLTGLPTGATVTYTNNDQIDAGAYTVTAIINGGTNYENVTQTAVLTIEKADIPPTVFDNAVFIYDGFQKSIFIENTLPIGVTVTYTNNDQIDAGTYTVTADLNGGTNYHNNTLTASLTIEKADIPTTVFNNAVFVYDGFPKSIFIENALPIGVTVSYTNNGQIVAGTYTVTANINGGANYHNATKSASMTIQKAPITGISFSSVTIPYDGTAKSIYISGTLPPTAVVTYQNNSQINLGTYPIVARIVGGNNYEDLVLNATLTIEKGVLSNVYLPSATYTYDGQQKSLQIGGGALPQGVTVSYVNNGHTDAGIYTVRAEINGGANYQDRVLQSLLTIKKAPIENITFSSATFTYDTTIKVLAVSGTIGAGMTVSYKNNAHSNAGVYTVIANIDGGQNYNKLQLTAQLIIEKASQFIDFKELDVVTLEDSVAFQLAAIADSGLAVSYSYTFTTETAAATVSESGWVIPKQPGIILVTAHQAGDHNYLQAPSVTRELRIASRDANIHELWIGSQHYIAPPEQIYYTMDCDDLKAKIKVVIQAQAGATMDPGQEFVIDIIKPGIHTQTIRITSENGAVTKEYQIIIEKPFPFHTIVQQKYNHVLLVNNNPKTNGGFKFVKFEWYKNDQLIGEEQVYSSGDKAVDVLDTKALYRAVLTSSTGQVLTVCPSYVELKNNVVFRLHPNPVEVGARIVLTISDAEFITIGAPLRIYDVRGRLLQQGVIEGYNTEVQLSSSIQSGVYLAVFKVKGQDKVIKFVVK